MHPNMKTAFQNASDEHNNTKGETPYPLRLRVCRFINALAISFFNLIKA